MNWTAVIFLCLGIGCAGASMGAMLQLAYSGMGVIYATSAATVAAFIAGLVARSGWTMSPARIVAVSQLMLDVLDDLSPMSTWTA